MERAFIVAEDSAYFKDQEKYRKMANELRTFVKKFMEDNGIGSNAYIVVGDGLCNAPFSECDKRKIRFGIIPTISDTEKYGSILTIQKQQDIRFFKANSAIAKEFAQKCVDEKIAINLIEPRLSDYFTSFQYKAYSKRYFEHKGVFYATIDCDAIDKNETPEGFEEIKLTELYRVIEEIQSEQAS